MASKSRLIVLGVVSALLCGCGFTGNLRLDPGFAAFRAPATLRDTDREFALSLGPIPLRLATMISRPIMRDEPWITAALSDVRAVRVYIYEIDGRRDRVQRHMDATAEQLLIDGWESIVAVREDGGLIRALTMQLDEQLVRGLVVMFQEDEELVLVNVIGKLRPETFALVLDGLDIEMPSVVFVGADSVDGSV